MPEAPRSAVRRSPLWRRLRRHVGWRAIIWWNRLRGRAVVPRPFKQLFVEPSSRCNLACRFCAYPLEVRPRTVMDDGAFQAHVDSADRVGVEHLWLTPMTGDVFMDKGIFDKLAAVQRSQVKALSFYTNFIAPDRNDIERLKTITKLRELHISIYGASEEAFVAIAAKPAQQFRRLVRNLEWLNEALGTWANPPSVMIQLRERGSFEPAAFAGPMADAVHALVRDHGASFWADSEYDNWGGLVTDEHVAGLDITFTQGEDLYHNGPCAQLFQSTMVTSTGQVVGCGCRGFDSGLLMGDASTEPLDDILSVKNPRWQALVRNMDAGQFPTVCQSCGMYRSIWDHRWARGTNPAQVTTLSEVLGK